MLSLFSQLKNICDKYTKPKIKKYAIQGAILRNVLAIPSNSDTISNHSIWLIAQLLFLARCSLGCLITSFFWFLLKPNNDRLKSIQLSGLLVNCTDYAYSLGAVFGSIMSFSNHVQTLCWSAQFQILNIWRIRSLLPYTVLVLLAIALVPADSYFLLVSITAICTDQLSWQSNNKQH